MSNFSLGPLALECKTLTKTALDQGALWSLIGSAHEHVVPEDDACSIRSWRLAWNSDIYTAEVSELYAVCLAKALVKKELTQYSRSAECQDSELCRKMARASKSNTGRGSVRSRTGENIVGVVKDLTKPNRVPARLWKPTEEPAPLPQAIPAADRFSWDGMGLDPNAESEEHRSRRKAEIQKEGTAAAILWKKRGQDKIWTEVKADLSLYAYSGGVVTTDPRREKPYVEAVLLGLGLGPRKPGERTPEQFKHLTEYDIAALTEVSARKAAVYWVEGSPRTTVRFMKHDTIPTGPPIKVPPHNLKGEAAQWVDDALEAEHKRGQLERGNSAW